MSSLQQQMKVYGILGCDAMQLSVC